MNKTGKKQENPGQSIIDNFKNNQKAIPRITTDVMLRHSSNQELVNYKQSNIEKVAMIEKAMATRSIENNHMSTIVATKIKDLKAKLRDLKDEIKGVRQSIKDAEDKYAKMTEEVNIEFNKKKEVILSESHEVENQLSHYAEWQKQSDSFKSHLSELKATIHHNRVLCSEGIAETRQNAQAKIEKHRIILADAIRQARAESLRLRSGDISKLSTSFLTLSEAHLKNLDAQIESSKHLSQVNESINEDNLTMQREIDRLSKKNDHLKEQEFKQRAVLAKLRAIKQEFEQKEAEEIENRKSALATQKEVKKQEDTVQVQDEPKQKPQFKLSSEQESFITFLNECATSIRSILIDMLGEKPDTPNAKSSDRFEAPKLSSMIIEIKEMTARIHNTKPLTPSAKKPTLTPAAAYFAFSAPFDESDNFIETENWSFAKYVPCKPPSVLQRNKPRIIRVKTTLKSSLL